MKAVFLVYRVTGEFDHYHEDVIWAFETSGECNGFCLCANAWLKENGMYYGSDEAEKRYRARRENPFPPNPFDPLFTCDYTGVKYVEGSTTYYEPPSV